MTLGEIWDWFTLKDLETAARESLKHPATAWFSANTDGSYVSYSACCGEHLIAYLAATDQPLVNAIKKNLADGHETD